MKTKSYFLLAILFMIWVMPVKAQIDDRYDVSYSYDPYTPELADGIAGISLIGFKGLGVSVRLSLAEIEERGITRDQIKTDVELRLRKAGIKILTDKECSETPGNPILYVIVQWVPSSSIYVVYNVQLQLKEDVKVSREILPHPIPGQQQPTIRAEIWSMGCFGTVRFANIKKIHEIVGERVDKFTSYYLQFNRR